MQKFLITALLTFGMFACEEATEPVDVPINVLEAFETAYPGATDVDWEQDDDHFEVEFTLNGEEMEREFDVNGMEMED
jgi:hypothetical protein